MSFAAVAMIMSSCTSQKDYLYLADMVDDQGYAITQRYSPKIQIDDRLLISVSCKNPELALPFNVSSGNVRVSTAVTSGSNIGTIGEQAASATTGDQSYRVDDSGDIIFPVLGKLHVAGLTLQECSNMISKRIIEGNYIKDPIVTTEFKNFHYSVLGAANGNGTYTVNGDRVTILEAIAKAGDLASNADLGQIAVIREDGGERRVYTVDIRNSDIFNSPAYYLAQNDILYVRPKKPKSEAKKSTLEWLTVALSIITAGCSLTWAIRR